MFHRSIRFKIIICFITLLFLAIFSFSFVLYNRLNHNLYKGFDDLIESKADGVVDSIDTYMQIESEIHGNLAGKLKKIAKIWVNEESKSTKLLNFIVQIFDSNGNIIASTRDVQPITTFSKKMYSELLTSDRFDTVNTKISQDKTIILRIFTTSVIENEKISYVVLIASPFTMIQLTLYNLKKLLFILFPIAIFFISFISMFFAEIILNPINKIIDTVQRITAKNLKLRVPVPNAKDEIQRLAITFNDMLERLDKAFLAQKHFIQDATHELKTPLTILKGEIEVALKKTRSINEYESIFYSSLEEIERLTKIIENLLILTKFEDGNIADNWKNFNLTELIDNILNDMIILFDQKNIKMKNIINEKVIIYGDSNQLKQVFFNIIDNAVKFTPNNGEIIVSVLKEADFVQIKIKDNGIGIQDSELPYIFDRFYRVDKARNTHGFGLGLSIAKAIIENHHGHISVQSVPNEFTIFNIFLPLFKD